MQVPLIRRNFEQGVGPTTVQRIQAVAAQLTQRLFRLLDHGGQLLIANFTPDSHGRGYMEAFMSWQLVYRDESELVACQCEIPPGEIRSQRVYRDSEGNIAHLLLERV